MDVTPPAVLRIMARQHGVLTLAQARAGGMTLSAVKRRVNSGEWRRLTQGVYVLADRPRTAAVELRAAVYAAGQGAVAYGPSAAWWHGLILRPSGRVWVTVPAARRLRRLTAVRVRHRDLDPADLVVVRDLTVTALPLTVLEAAVELRAGSMLMDRALRDGIGLDTLRAAHERNAGRRGADPAARLLSVAADGGVAHAERLLVRLLRAAGIDGWWLRYGYLDYDVDLAFPRERLAIEIVGWEWSRGGERLGYETERRDALLAGGWTVLRVTWHRLAWYSESALAEIVRSLAAAES